MHFCLILFILLGSLNFTSSLTCSNHIDEHLDIRIPVVDMRDFYNNDKREDFLDTLFDAMTSVGFFAVSNTGVNAHVIKNAYAQAEKFFKQDAAYKYVSFVKELRGQRGFVPGEFAKGNKRKDKKEFFRIGRENSLLKNIWPSQPGFKESLTQLYNELETYVTPLQQAIIATINQHSTTKIDLNFLNDMTKTGDSLLASIYYPALKKNEVNCENPPVYWAAPHTDIDLLAILPYATTKGLQVEINGQWLNVVVPEDAFIVNVGDMLENISNGLFVSARHRVVAQETNKDRFSMVFFVHPYDEAPLNPVPACIELTGGQQDYASGTRQEFLWERLLELDTAHGLLEPYSKTGHTERQIQYGRESPQVVDLLIKNELASTELLEAIKLKNNNS